MTEPSTFLPGQDPPAEPVAAADGPARQPNRLDHMGFLLQLVQVAPMAMSLFGVFLSSVWALRVTTAAALVAGWVAITLLSHDRDSRISRASRASRTRRIRRVPRKRAGDGER